MEDRANRISRIGSVIVGHKALNLDNQRWGGSVDWRQIDQTLVMARAEVTALKGVSLSDAHAWRVNRIFGPRSSQGIWRDTDFYLLRGAAHVKQLGQTVAYGYLLRVPHAPIYGTSTFGARLAGRQAVGNLADGLRDLYLDMTVTAKGQKRAEGAGAQGRDA